MTLVVVDNEVHRLPIATEDVIPVLIYGLNESNRVDISQIGHPVIDKVKRLGLSVSPAVMDFLTISLAITAADTFVRRDNADDGWTRQIELQITLCSPEPWLKVMHTLERALHFLSGDMWSIKFCAGGFAPPSPYLKKYRYKLFKLRGLDCVSLFSGGLDSAIGAIDLLAEDRRPLLVSHAYKGDKSYQEAILSLLRGRYTNFPLNADPHSPQPTDITMRTRSINFLAMAALGAQAIQEVNQLSTVELFVPENGVISLNAPLTTRRIGSLSTRTTHPYFLSLVQEIFDLVGIDCRVVTPYQFLTKGEMVLSCKNQLLLSNVYNHTVSCSHWKRANKQCGTCVPCLIRRASLYKGGFVEQNTYQNADLDVVTLSSDVRDDLLAMSSAISQLESRKIGPWLLNSGPLPAAHFENFKSVFTRGLKEVESFLLSEGVRC